MSAYETDLAYIHDVGFGHHSSLSAPELLSQLAQRGILDGRVVDLGCGSGIWAKQLLDAGYDVTGIDYSPAMLRIAQRTAPAAEFVRGSFFDTALPRCSAVTSLGECLGYLFDNKSNLRTLTKLFGRVHDALAKGGLFMFDLAGPGRGKTKRRQWDEEDWALILHVDEEERILTRKITTFVRRGHGGFYRDKEVHNLRLYSASEILKGLRSVGFKARTLHFYKPWPSGLNGYVAWKESNK